MLILQTVADLSSSCVLVFELEDWWRRHIHTYLNTGPYYAAVISSHGYPAGNDTYLGQFNCIRNMNLGVYRTYTLITNSPFHDQQEEVGDGEGRQLFKTLLTLFSLKLQENYLIQISSYFWADTKAQPVFLLAYEGMVASLQPFWLNLKWIFTSCTSNMHLHPDIDTVGLHISVVVKCCFTCI